MTTRYRRLLADLRYGCVIPWRAPQAALERILAGAARVLWPAIAPLVDRQLANRG